MRDLMVKDVSKAYGDLQVLSGLNLRFPGGAVTCVLGPSGFGKTTLLRIIAGLEEPDAGSVEGVPERIGFVFQEDRLCEEFSAVSNVRLGAGKDMPKEEIVRRAVCCPAELLILDEPFKGLDEKLRLEVIGFIRRYTQGRTVICVTHEPEDAERLGGGIVEMEKAGA